MSALMLVMPFGVFGDLTDGTFTYIEVGTNEATITGTRQGVALSGNVAIPSVVMGRRVTAIGAGALQNHVGLTSVTIPDSVRTIGTQAFSGNAVLQSVDLGNGVTRIDNRAFSGTAIESVLIPQSVTSMSSWTGSATVSAFSGALGLTAVVFEEGMTTIPSHALMFQSGVANSITSVTIPASVRTIGSNAFNSRNEYMAIYGVRNSFAHQFAIDNSIPFHFIDGNGQVRHRVDFDTDTWRFPNFSGELSYELASDILGSYFPLSVGTLGRYLGNSGEIYLCFGMSITAAAINTGRPEVFPFIDIFGYPHTILRGAWKDCESNRIDVSEN